MLYIVTASHNRKKITTEFAIRLKASEYQDFVLLLVDDGSSDGTEDSVRSILNNKVIVLKGNGNLWWGGSLHKAYKWLCKNAQNDDIILISNDDVYYSKDYIGKGVDIVSSMKNQLLLGLAYSDETGILFDAPIQWDYSIAEGKKKNVSPWIGNCSSTRSLFLKVSDMKTIGGFHPFLIPHYLSDYEWTIRACKRGYKIVSNEELSYTMCESTTGIRKKSNLKFGDVFSKKSNINPLYRFNFIILTTPPKYWFKAFVNQAKRMSK